MFASLRVGCLLGIVALSGCVGDECHFDSDCLSESCTWGTCDSVLTKELREKREEPEPEPEPSCHETVDCTWLEGDKCSNARGCQRDIFCTGPIGCDHPLEGCPQPCEGRSESECTGACTPIFLSCEPLHDCSRLSEYSCESTPGCAFE